MNKCMFVGRVCNTPEMKTVRDKTVATFRLAVDGRNNKTTFVPCEAWNKAAEILAKYAEKGRELAIEAHLKQRQYEVEGKKRSAYEFVVENFTLVGRRTTNDENEESANAESE